MSSPENRLALTLASSVNAATLGPKVIMFTLSAAPDELGQAAEELGVDSVREIEVEGRMSRRRDIVRLSAKVRAIVVQTCVVSLEPVESVIETELKRSFGAVEEDSGEIDIDPLSEDPPEPMENGAVPVGNCIIEQILLEIDPYPRKQGLEFVDIVEDDEDDTGTGKPASPFAALATLKDKLN
ncbi:MAG: DUF177 domain-containing protein [Rhodospirillales bacterium]